MSEVYGRRIPLFSGYVCFAIFQIPVACAHNIETIMISRFLSGLAASAPLAVVGGALADLYDPIERLASSHSLSAVLYRDSLLTMHRTYAVCCFAAGTVSPIQTYECSNDY